MPWVQRIKGKVVGEFAIQQPGIANEFVPDSQPEVQSFRQEIDSYRRLSRRQFAEALLGIGKLNAKDAKDFAKGELPADMKKALNKVPKEQRDAAELFMIAETDFGKNHPTFAIVAEAMGWREEDVAEMWRQAPTS